MERVWAELRRIEAQADQIRSEAQTKAKEMVNVAKQEAEQLLATSKTYAEKQGHDLKQREIREANKSRVAKLKASDENLDEVERVARKRMPVAEQAVVDAVLGKNKQ